jgi:predicted nucleic acid-binding Zn ribbon protein
MFEDFKSMSAPPLTKCPKCKGKVDRLIGRGAGIIFRGSGFYETDYKRKNWKSDAAADKAASTGKSESASKSGNGADKPTQNKKAEKKETTNAAKKD